MYKTTFHLNEWRTFFIIFTFLIAALPVYAQGVLWEKKAQHWFSATGDTLFWAFPIEKQQQLGLELKGLKGDAGFLSKKQNATESGSERFFPNISPGAIYSLTWTLSDESESFFEKKTDIIAAPSRSSGDIKVFFTSNTLNTPNIPGPMADGTGLNACLNAFLTRIQAAEQTIDVAMYNNNRVDLTNALKGAALRGVRVRYIADASTNNSAIASSPLFPVLYENGEGLMHNKFLIIDAESANPNKPIVITGSTNWSTSGLAYDHNNIVVIQDQALARGYTLEFEEMWGSTGALPNGTLARFGSRKTKNTPTLYTIGGHVVESRFSPSDGTTAAILSTMNTTDEEFLFSLLLFTNWELTNGCLNLHRNGKRVQGIVNDPYESSSQFGYLVSGGISVQEHPDQAILHHKYGLADPLRLDSDPTVVTGSHNWTFSAETINDENTLIIHDGDTAAKFYREYRARALESPVSTEFLSDMAGVSVFPNPTFGRSIVTFSEKHPTHLRISDVLGQQVLHQIVTEKEIDLDLSHLPSGLYWLHFYGKNAVSTFPLQKI